MQFIVQTLPQKYGKPKYVGMMVSRFRGHGIVRIFGHVHHLASHSPLHAKWKHVERKLMDRYCPNLYKAVELGIRKEKL